MAEVEIVLDLHSLRDVAMRTSTGADGLCCPSKAEVCGLETSPIREVSCNLLVQVSVDSVANDFRWSAFAIKANDGQTARHRFQQRVREAFEP